ncbi:hypothetical protein TELCIR_22412 [Teladorsagia circumcincta]|uniref:Uncharacterized protein n=1 Tax=Teladorsagia circumcincta TaxID=45464 RepID=A0A2G9TE05_TELCI|nr:hypothetical protein TELCIR_22412 [Teladorsagia circumcincta]
MERRWTAHVIVGLHSSSRSERARLSRDGIKAWLRCLLDSGLS